MKIIFLIIVGLCLWPCLAWISKQFIGWGKWEKRFGREVNNDNDIAASVALKKFGNYNRCVRVGVEDYGIAFAPTFFLLFHRSFCIPWVQILGYHYTPGRLSNTCLLRTTGGTIRISGDIAEVIARWCANHFVTAI